MLTFFILKFFYQFIAFIAISSLEKITGPRDYFEILPVSKLKKVEKHCSRPVLRYFFEPAAHFENFFKLAEHLDQV